VNGYEINSDFPGELFDIDRLKRVYSADVPENMDLWRQNIEKQIKDFKRIYE
jgi:hypothetical protein